MCGRYAFTQTDGAKLKKRFKLAKLPKGLKPRFNIAPSQDIPVILNESPDELSLARWGLIPSWAKEQNTKYSMINAKAETITEKPAYRGPIRHKRCLIPADSFYEWQKTGGAKQPYRIFMKDEGLFAFAGIWDLWEKQDHHIVSCSIITTAPNRLVKGIHERMPVILKAEDEETWLKEKSFERALKLLAAYDAKAMDAYPISPDVNSPQNNSADILNAL